MCLRDRGRNADKVFGLVLVDDDIALVVEALVEQPAEDALSSAGSAIREAGEVPYSEVTLPDVITRQWTSPPVCDQRSMRANEPSVLGL